MATSSNQLTTKEQIAQLCTITGADEKTAENLLDACAGNLEMAINMAVDGPATINNDLDINNQQPHSVERSRRRSKGEPSAVASAATSTSMDANVGGDDVRAPIPKKREVLVEEGYHQTYGFRGGRRPARSVFDGFRDFQRETKVQEAMLTKSTDARKLKTLEDLFRPPVDLMHKGSFESAREAGQVSGKWLMVNIQNVREFPCQVLNRDVWSSDAVRLIIKEHFVFWQVYHDSSEGERFLQFYKVTEYPYVAILDPRTGENLSIWHRVDAPTFCESVTDFISQHPTIQASPPNAEPPRKKICSESILDASEDSQLEAAIVASLVNNSETTQEGDETDSSGSEIETFSDSGSEAASPVKKNQGKSQKASITAQQEQKTISPVRQVPCKKKLHMPQLQPQASDQSKKDPAAVNGKAECEWKKHLGPETDPNTNLMIRFPDGKREQLNVPSSSKLMALVHFTIAKGFPNERYELVTNFPRRKLSYMDFNVTLKDIGLFPQETVFVQER
ncbi:PREDICTED: UBX domain-containing protein 7-like [Priapulus caudatus]|uniref:UBX domain-containing protein 7 n=1 Tax=Priapulus caudatus TaxID=37621 RepID=A0ABM1E301_PRICU|nr:PREDICTED: UBX domain-containing protein 7-like [Priapulus caudatus]